MIEPSSTRWRFGLFLPAVFCTLLWGSAFPAIKIGFQLFSIGADDTFSKVLFAGIRFALAGAAVLAFMPLLGRRRFAPRRSLIPNLLLLSLTQTGLQYALFYISLAHIAGSKGAMVKSTTVFFTVIFAHFMFKTDRLTKSKIVGCAIGFAGVILVNLSGPLDGYGSFSFQGEGLMLLAAISSGIASPITKRIAERGGDPILATGWQLLTGGSLLLVCGLLGGGYLGHISLKGIVLLIYLVFLSAASFAVSSTLLKYYPASRVAIYNFLIPVFGTLLSGLFLHEDVLRLRNLLALILVSGGIALVGHRKLPEKAARL